MLGSKWRARGVGLPATCGIWFRLLDCPQWLNKGRGKNLPFMAKNSKWWVLFWFSTIYRNFISPSGFFPIVWKSIQLIPYFVWLWNRFFIIINCCCSNRVVLSFPIHFWHLYSIHINLSNQPFATDYGIINH